MTLNYHADNLEPEQIRLVERVVGENRVCLCRAITQVAISRTSFLGNNFPEMKESNLLPSTFKSHHETSFNWHLLLRVGVVTFTRSQKRRKYYIQAVDMDKERVVIEYQIKSHVVFERRRRFIVLFETELGMVCLNFVDNDEADDFFDILSNFMHKQTRALKQIQLSVVQNEGDSKTGLMESDNQGTIFLFQSAHRRFGGRCRHFKFASIRYVLIDQKNILRRRNLAAYFYYCSTIWPDQA